MRKESNRWSEGLPRSSAGRRRPLSIWKTQEKRPRLHAALEKLEPKLPERGRYCFGGVVAGGLVAGAAGLMAGDVPGLTGLGATRPAAGAGTPDWRVEAYAVGWVTSTAGPDPV